MMFRWANTTKKWLHIVASLVSLGSPSATAQTPGAAQTQSVPPELEAVIDESDKALREILNGDPSGYAALFADRDDITLGNRFGPFGKGRAAVIAALNNAAKKYTDGSVVRVEHVAIYGGGDHYVRVEMEHDRAKLRTATDFSAFSARITSVYEKIGARWKLVHRHAAPITSARPAESVLSAIVPKGIVGTWCLVSFEDVEDGKIVRPAKSPGEVKWIIGPCLRASPGQMQALVDNSVAYWGTYTVDLAAGVATHNVLSDLSNGYVGTIQPRPFYLNGGRLVIGDGKTSPAVLERVVP